MSSSALEGSLPLSIYGPLYPSIYPWKSFRASQEILAELGETEESVHLDIAAWSFMLHQS